jgi:ABC-type uncharacterized transport system substrate-binding protein
VAPDPSRRRLIQGSLALAGLALLAGCGIPFGPAAQPARLRRIGWLSNGSPTTSVSNFDALRQGLGELGYVEGRDIVIEPRFAEGREERLPELAAELVGSNVDIIIAGTTPVVRAAGLATTTIPIVFVTVEADPAADGLIDSLARPGGNMTGLTLYAGQENAKRLELLKETSPGLSRVAILWRQSGVGAFRETEAAAQTLGVQVLSLEIRSPDDLDTVLDVAATGRADGLVVASGSLLSVLAPRIVAWAAGHRLPAIYPSSSFADYGGLMVYSASMTENWRRAATYIDKILKGAKPGDLPVERPTRFDFIVNLRTAQALGLTIPQSILQQATKVIE